MATNFYALGSSDREHQRLMRQAEWLVERTGRWLAQIGIGAGQRLMDVGSGVGDVSVLAAKLVGASGEVVGVERDARSIARAEARMAAEGLRHVRFVEADLERVEFERPFDAAVGRYILMFLREPAQVVRAVARHVKPGGMVGFQEPDFDGFIEMCRGMELWERAGGLLVETFERSGTNTRMGKSFGRAFDEAGLGEPEVRRVRLTGAERWMPDCLISLKPAIEELGLSTGGVGDFETLFERLMEEARACGRPAPMKDLVSAWARKR